MNNNKIIDTVKEVGASYAADKILEKVMSEYKPLFDIKRASVLAGLRVFILDEYIKKMLLKYDMTNKLSGEAYERVVNAFANTVLIGLSNKIMSGEFGNFVQALAYSGVSQGVVAGIDMAM